MRGMEAKGFVRYRRVHDVNMALYNAAAGGWVDIVDVLLRRGGKREYRDRTGRSVVDIARENGRENVLKILNEPFCLHPPHTASFLPNPPFSPPCNSQLPTKTMMEVAYGAI